MQFFSKSELKAVCIILLLIFSATLFNYQIAYRRGRDNQRKNDFGDLVRGIESYHETVGFYPPSSEDGKIRACSDRALRPEEDPFKLFTACEWGKDELRDYSGKTGDTFIKTLPQDPYHKDGRIYFYISDGTYYQIYGALEGKDEDEFNPRVEARNIVCGKDLYCNYGRSSNKTPLDISLEEYKKSLDNEKETNKK